MKGLIFDVLHRPHRWYWTFKTMLLMSMGRLYVFRDAPFWFLGYAATHVISHHEPTSRWGSEACKELMLRLERLERAIENGQEQNL